jgi:hypothetical protein
MKRIIGVVVALAVLVGGFYIFNSYIYSQKQAEGVADFKNATYIIDSTPVTLKNGVAEVEAAPGSASKITTRYFGNELKTDLDGDGREDIVFLLTQNTGGSGTFYYVVSALNTSRGYVGSDAYLLGDRIAPQTTEVSQNPNQKYVIIVNYADRAPGEPMTTSPSVGKSVYLKLDPTSMQWGIIESNFEGESSSGIQGIAMLGPTCPVMKNPPDPQCADKPFETSLVVTTADGVKILKTFSTAKNGAFSVALPAGEYAVRSASSAPLYPRCASSDTIVVKSGAYTSINISCDTGIR